MNGSDARYTKFALVREMLETAEVIRKLPLDRIFELSHFVDRSTVLFTGEGSSRIFPAKKSLYDALRHRYDGRYVTEAATQALEYDLSAATVFVASNSGKTKECVRLIRKLRADGNRSICGIVANAGTPVQQEADASYLLSCGPEQAVAATKSVIEEALVYDLLLRRKHGKPLPDLVRLADALTRAMQTPIPAALVDKLSGAPTLYWAGRNNGVAEELSLKTNEITRKKSDFLEGTYAVHGIEEVMSSAEAVIVVDPYPEEEEKFHEVLEQGVGLAVVALASRETRFETLRIPQYEDFSPYIQLAAGWSLLVEIGLRGGINLDKAVRARKVGNEFRG